MRVCSWNVRGVRAGFFEDLLGDAEIELGWSILCLQEFTASRFIERFESSVGHRVFFTAPSEGCRACCIVIHASIAHRVLGYTFVHKSRGVAVALHWEGWNLLVVCPHLYPKHGRTEYSDSLQQLEELADIKDLRNKFISSGFGAKDMLNTPVYTIVGVDAQAPVGPPQTRAQEFCIGPATSGIRTWKGTQFVNFCLERNLRIWNTFAKDTNCVWTCNHDLKHEPNQIDYVLSDLPTRSINAAGVTDSTASDTDHRATFVAVLGTWLVPRKPRISYGPTPPVGWSIRDPSFNDQLRTLHGWDKP